MTYLNKKIIIITHVRNDNIKKISHIKDSQARRIYTKYDIILLLRAKAEVRIGTINGPEVSIVDDKFIRSDGNKFKADYLGKLPKF